MIWYKDYGFEYNPLCIKPLEEFELFFDDKNLMRNMKQVIDDGNNIILKGSLGTGKTSILKKIINEYGGKRKLFYYNAYSSSIPLDYELVLKRAGSFLSRNLGIKSKNVILFIDEAQHFEKDNLKRMTHYLKKYFKAIILASSDPNYDVPEELKKYFQLTINTGNFTETDAFNIIKDRLGQEYQEILNDEEIKTIYNKSKTQREFLLECDATCKQKYEKKQKKIMILFNKRIK